MNTSSAGGAAFMVPSKSRLVQLRAASAPSDRDEPVGAKLASLAIAAQQLDAITREAVTASRDAGLSWSQIGAALGVSRQAAHQRYGNA
ncbi:hypothetical protein ACTXPS_16500 [Brachybacterium tyrofermentans]|uniref:hypothetical protein n=1 Tax=Brachybacterium tyrofermentans TaxID=47848 RepID=UPI003FCFFC8A